MILKDIADLVGLDISTVSHVANSKYVRDSLWHKVDQRIFSEAMKMIRRRCINTRNQEDTAKYH
jgi:RNA polymerase sigma-54 factor